MLLLHEQLDLNQSFARQAFKRVNIGITVKPILLFVLKISLYNIISVNLWLLANLILGI